MPELTRFPHKSQSGRRRRDSWQLYTGVFCLFAPLGVLLFMVQQPPQGWLLALVTAAFAGLISVGWSYTFVRGKWWVLAPLMIAPFVLPQGLIWVMGASGLYKVGLDYPERTRLIVMAVMCIAFTSAGFALLVVHLRKSERVGARAMAELELAGRVHTSLVPAIAVTTACAEIYGRSKASSSMGGDLIDAVAPGTDGAVTVVLADVSGHGVAAGIVMAMLKGCIRTRLLRSTDLADVITDTNAVLTELTEPHMFATLAALRVSPRDGGAERRVEFALAGHLPIYHYNAAERRWKEYPNQCLPLGVDGAERFTAGVTHAAPGDLLAVFTDGLVEVQDAQGRELGMDGVAAALAACRLDGPLAAIDSDVCRAVDAHGVQIDDQSLVLVRIV